MICNFECYAKYLLKSYVYKHVINGLAWSLMPIIPALWETEAGALTEVKEFKTHLTNLVKSCFC